MSRDPKDVLLSDAQLSSGDFEDDQLTRHFLAFASTAIDDVSDAPVCDFCAVSGEGERVLALLLGISNDDELHESFSAYVMWAVAIGTEAAAFRKVARVLGNFDPEQLQFAIDVACEQDRVIPLDQLAAEVERARLFFESLPGPAKH